MEASTIKSISDSAPVATYSSAAASVAFWGMHVNEICAVVSTLIALIGLGLQFYLVMHRLRRVERVQSATVQVVSAVAGSQREVAKRVDNLENTEGKT